jgi:hypothetical protein
MIDVAGSADYDVLHGGCSGVKDTVGPRKRQTARSVYHAPKLSGRRVIGSRIGDENPTSPSRGQVLNSVDDVRCR